MPMVLSEESRDDFVDENWWVAVKHPDNSDEFAQIHQFENFKPKSYEDFKFGEFYVLKSTKWNVEKNVKRYRVYITRIEETKQSLKESLKKTRPRFPRLNPTDSDILTSESEHEQSIKMKQLSKQRPGPSEVAALKRNAATPQLESFLDCMPCPQQRAPTNAQSLAEMSQQYASGSNIQTTSPGSVLSSTSKRVKSLLPKPRSNNQNCQKPPKSLKGNMKSDQTTVSPLIENPISSVSVSSSPEHVAVTKSNSKSLNSSCDLVSSLDSVTVMKPDIPSSSVQNVTPTTSQCNVEIPINSIPIVFAAQKPPKCKSVNIINDHTTKSPLSNTSNSSASASSLPEKITKSISKPNSSETVKSTCDPILSQSTSVFFEDLENLIFSTLDDLTIMTPDIPSTSGLNATPTILQSNVEIPKNPLPIVFAAPPGKQRSELGNHLNEDKAKIAALEETVQQLQRKLKKAESLKMDTVILERLNKFDERLNRLETSVTNLNTTKRSSAVALAASSSDSKRKCDHSDSVSTSALGSSVSSAVNILKDEKTGEEYVHLGSGVRCLLTSYKVLQTTHDLDDCLLALLYGVFKENAKCYGLNPRKGRKPFPKAFKDVARCLYESYLERCNFKKPYDTKVFKTMLALFSTKTRNMNVRRNLVKDGKDHSLKKNQSPSKDEEYAVNPATGELIKLSSVNMDEDGVIYIQHSSSDEESCKSGEDNDSDHNH